MLSRIQAERFKTRAVDFPIWRDQRTRMQRATLGESGSEFSTSVVTRWDSESIFQKQFEMTAAIQYILTAAQSLGSQDYKSLE